MSVAQARIQLKGGKDSKNGREPTQSDNHIPPHENFIRNKSSKKQKGLLLDSNRAHRIQLSPKALNPHGDFGPANAAAASASAMVSSTSAMLYAPKPKTMSQRVRTCATRVVFNSDTTPGTKKDASKVRHAILKNEISVTTAIDEDMDFEDSQEAYDFAVGSIDNLLPE